MTQDKSHPLTATRLAGHVARLARDGSITFAPSPPGPPQRIDGYTLGVSECAPGPGPHAGEVHPDADELLYVVRGRLEVILDDGDEHRRGEETTVVVNAGEAFVVPRGVWHRVVATERTELINATPGPHGGFRPR